MSFKIAAILILSAVYVYEMFVNYLGARAKNDPVPECVADVYDGKTYKKWQAYHGEKFRIKMIGDTVGFVTGAALIFFNSYAAFASLFEHTDFMQMFAVILLSAASELPQIPIDYYDTMKIEGKYGFNRSTEGTFFGDKIKEFIISLGFVTGIGAMLIGIHHVFGDWMIVIFAAALILVMIFIAFLFPYFSRIFNKFTPLPDGELKDRLTSLLEKHGYRVRAINVMDASRRSTKSNAYFAGLGKTKTIVLYDTLIESMTPDEICAVFAHELGHGLHKDTVKMQFFNFVRMFLIALFAWLTLRTEAIYPDFGFEGVNYGMAVVLIMSVEFALIAPLYELVENFISRRAEFRADGQAVNEGYGEALISALKKLGRENFANLSPDPLYVKLTYSHPPLAQRIEAMRAKMKEEK